MVSKAVVVKNLPANAGDARNLGLIPGSGRSPGGGNGNALQYSCLENSMDRVHGIAELNMTESACLYTYMISKAAHLVKIY